MNRIAWSDEFSVGVKKMDFQHQRIIRIYNTLVDHAQEGADSETISEVLAELVEYASMHFKSEEQLLQEHEYPELRQQKAEHLEYRRQTGEFCLLVSEHDAHVPHELLNYVHDWWTHHILHEDKKYGKFLEEKRNLNSDARD